MPRFIVVALIDVLVLGGLFTWLGNESSVLGRALGPKIGMGLPVGMVIALIAYGCRTMSLSGSPISWRNRIVPALVGLLSWPAVVQLASLDVHRKRVVLIGAVATLYVVAGAPLVRGFTQALARRSRPAWAGLILVVMLAALQQSGFRSSRPEVLHAPKNPYNVLLITIDTTRADMLGCYGQEWNTSPNLDSLASEGVLFEQAISQASHTHSSIASLLTSTYPIEHRSLRGLYSLPKSMLTLAEHLATYGYETAAFLDNPWLIREFQFDQGYLDFKESANNPDILAWLDEAEESPFFLHVHLLQPHGPYLAVKPWIDEFQPDYPDDADYQEVGPIEVLKGVKRRADSSLDAATLSRFKALHASEVRDMDEQIGEIMAHLEQLELDDDTIVIVVADHGEEFLEHGSMGHANSLYEELIHVPLIFKFPTGAEVPGARVAETAQLIDVVPTLLEVLGVPAPPETRGVSWIPFLKGGATPASTAVSQLYKIHGRHLVTLQSNKWKLHVYATPLDVHGYDEWSLEEDSGDAFTTGNRFQLFDLEEDPGEQIDLSLERPEVVAEMLLALREWRSASESRRPGQ